MNSKRNSFIFLFFAFALILRSDHLSDPLFLFYSFVIHFSVDGYRRSRGMGSDYSDGYGRRGKSSYFRHIYAIKNEIIFKINKKCSSCLNLE